MIHNDQKRMGQGHCRSLLATPEGQAVILGREIAILTGRRRGSRFYQRRAQPLTPFVGLATEAFASAFMIARAHSCPGGPVVSTWGGPHGACDLGPDDFG